MKTVFTWVVRIAVLLLIVKIVMWSWDKYQEGGQEGSGENVSEFDKICKITNPDFGSCVCVHRQTNERLENIPYEECVKRAREGNR